MSSPDIEVKCFSQRVADGIYDHVADAVTNLGKDGLGEADFSIDWTTTVQDNYSGTNWSYVNTKDGHPFRTNIVGQIATSACGTKHSAKGTHFTKKNMALSDSDTVKWKWALSKPTLSSPNLTDIWENQLTSIEDWITEEKKRAVTKPEGDNTNQDVTPRRTKRKNANEDSMAGQQSMTASTSSIASSNMTLDVPTPTADKVSPGALYDPRILPDYRGTLKLIPMHESYSKLRPGTLVLAVCDAHVYNMVQNGQPTSTFQLGMQAMKVLDPSDEPVEERLIPILSTTSVEMSKDDSAIAGFSTFDVAISPTKKNQAKWTKTQRRKR
ncbi:hypothetical protein DFH29DRAFT_1074665 [Suillus ampliporus]|nr:hypothetical protein DFH29DRAFT_1074665 [Suillus ampliporus]